MTTTRPPQTKFLMIDVCGGAWGGGAGAVWAYHQQLCLPWWVLEVVVVVTLFLCKPSPCR